MSFVIKNFNVSNTTTGVMLQDGRYTPTQVNNILSHQIVINGTTNKTQVPGTPANINSSSSMYNKSHMCISYIKLNSTFKNNSSTDEIFIVDRIIRVTYLGCN